MEYYLVSFLAYPTQRPQLITRTREEWTLARPDLNLLPPPNSLSIPGLAIYNGFRCVLPNCKGERRAISRWAKVVQNHIRRVHSGIINSRAQPLEGHRMQPVLLADFFSHPAISAAVHCWVRK